MIGDGIHGTPIFDENGIYYFVNGNNLVNGKIIIKSDTKKVNETEYIKYKKNINENTVLLSINGTIGNIAYYNNEPIILGKSAAYITLFPSMVKDYISIILKSTYFLEYATNKATQTTIKNVSLKAMRDLPIPLPPLAEQHRIVANLFSNMLFKANSLKSLEHRAKSIEKTPSVSLTAASSPNSKAFGEHLHWHKQDLPPRSWGKCHEVTKGVLLIYPQKNY